MSVTKTWLALSATALAATALTAGIAGATPAVTPPAAPPAGSITSVTAQLDALARQSEQLAEKYNAATIALDSVRSSLRVAQAAATAAAQRRDQAQAQFVQMVQAQYESGGDTSFGSLMTSDSRQHFLEQQGYADLAAEHAADLVTAFKDATVRANQARAAEAVLVAKARAEVTSLASARTAVQQRTAKLKTLLASLTAAQQRAYAARDAATRAQIKTVTAPAKTTKQSSTSSKSKHTRTKSSGGSSISVHAGSAAAQRAVDFALAQVGKPYVFAASGPDSYDCSGLTMAAWRRGGVHLPHLAASQYNYGHHVGWDELQPGDLIFLYWPIGHVEIYIGNGMAVSAPQPGENVEIIRIAYSRSQFHGATRLT